MAVNSCEPLPEPTAAATPTVFTIGHSTRGICDFIALLREVGTDLLVDVRSVPRSRAQPQFNADALAQALAAAGISYHHLAELGGLRRRQKHASAPANTLWRNESFRNYADYAATDAFRAGLNQLLAFSSQCRCTVMCAEAVWWRCHRRIIADRLLATGVPVMHIMGHNRIDAATFTPGARVLSDGTLIYASRRPATGRPSAPDG
jgi:uncharacterized protein (DUF488 family)